MRWFGGIKVRHYRKQWRANYVSMPSLKPQYPGEGLGTKVLGWLVVALLASWAGMSKCRRRICHLSYAAMPES